MDLNTWLKNVDKVYLRNRGADYKAKKVFKAVLRWIVINEHRGGCHDTSAALHMLLTEQGVNSILCIGEVRIHERIHFDHSWVTVDELVFDASVCMPNMGGRAFPPVFASKDLSTLNTPTIYYGEESGQGFDNTAKFVSRASLAEYSSAHRDKPEMLWKLTKTLAKEAGFKVNAGKLKNRYGTLTRNVV